jgi:hypothetical protein
MSEYEVDVTVTIGPHEIKPLVSLLDDIASVYEGEHDWEDDDERVLALEGAAAARRLIAELTGGHSA